MRKVTIGKGKGNAIPLQAWTGPKGSRSLRLPHISRQLAYGGGKATFTPRKYSWYLFLLDGPGSSVGIATDYGLDGTGIESR